MLRVFHHWFSARKLAFFVVDAVSIALGALFGAGFFSFATASSDAALVWPEGLPLLALLAVSYAGCFQLALYALDLYDLRIAGRDRSTGQRLLRAAGVAAILMATAVLPIPRELPPGALLGGAFGAILGSLLARSAIPGLFGLAAPSRLLILGNGQRARAIASAVADQGDDLFEVCLFLDPKEVSSGGQPLEVAAARHCADYVVVACDEQRGVVGAEALLRCRLRGFKVYDAAGFCERVLRRIPVAFLRASDLAYADEITLTRTRRAAKRAFDVIAATLLLIVAGPLMVLTALLIKLDSKGPVFYRQVRCGLDGKTYSLWKFRSMRTDAETGGAVWARLNDDRVTRVGRLMRATRVDEIPQVFNVLLGHMSFVGPRPERPFFVEQLKQLIPFYALREATKPGITGWAQIRYPYGASVEDARNKLELDLYYVKNGSLFLDVAIIFHTVRHVFLGRGAR
ncbi:MAG: exopolysaccharide biosynthesis polyprenyl glycosylphosphotransferase [Myxococcaceae bacterium]